MGDFSVPDLESLSLRALDTPVKPVKGKRTSTSRYSTRSRIATLRKRLTVAKDSRTRATIEAQLAAFERPPRGSYD
jgi:hypothetical protein